MYREGERPGQWQRLTKIKPHTPAFPVKFGTKFRLGASGSSLELRWVSTDTTTQAAAAAAAGARVMADAMLSGDTRFVAAVLGFAWALVSISSCSSSVINCQSIAGNEAAAGTTAAHSLFVGMSLFVSAAAAATAKAAGQQCNSSSTPSTPVGGMGGGGGGGDAGSAAGSVGSIQQAAPKESGFVRGFFGPRPNTSSSGAATPPATEASAAGKCGGGGGGGGGQPAAPKGESGSRCHT